MQPQWATVANDSPLLILTGGAQTPLPALQLPGYTPVTDDRVLYVTVDGQLVVLGTAT